MAQEHSESESATSAGTSLAGQLLSALQLTQDVTLQFVSAWFDGASEVVSKLTEMAVAPIPRAVPSASELLTFVQQLHTTQQDFFNELVVKADPVSFIGSLKAAQVALLAKPADVAAATEPLYERVARTVTRAEWELYAPYVARIEELKRERNAVVLAHVDPAAAKRQPLFGLY